MDYHNYTFAKIAVISTIFGISATSAFAAAAYPVQEFRFGIANTDRNISISGKNAGDYLSSATFKGVADEKWTLNYISAGVYEIVNSATGMVVTNEKGIATLAKDTDAANQRWQITAIENDFEGYPLYYKVVSNADPTQALTFDINSNSIAVDTYSKDNYQKFKFNLDGLEGYAANAMTPKGEKAGTIGGLLGETIEVNNVADLVAALNRTEPLTVVVNGDLDMVNQDKTKQRIRDNKTLVGSYNKNTIYDCQFRNDDFYGADDAPSNNIVIRNLNLVARTLNSTGSGMLLLYIYGGRNIWVDHNNFSATFEQNRDVEVGKFIWINTPSVGWSDDKYNGVNPDYITISYNYFKNRYWTVAFGSQNKDTSRLRTTLLFNKWEQCSRRTPQYSNGYHHNYGAYHTVTGGSNPNASSQVIGGEGSRILNENCRFEAYTGKEIDIDKNSALGFYDYNSYTSSTVGGTPTKLSTKSMGVSWKASDSYGYHLVNAYNANGKDVKEFTNTYSGCFKQQGKIKYITDADLSAYVSQSYPSPFLKSITVGNDPVGGLKEGAILDATKKFVIKNVNSSLFLGLAEGDLENGLDVVQGSVQTPWTVTADDDGYYYVKLAKDAAYFLDLANGNTGNGTNIAIWQDTKNPAQLFKFVLNEDKSYSITTSNTKDKSCLGIGAGSKEENASVIQWTCDGTDNQKWTLEEYAEPEISETETGDGDSSKTDPPQTIAAKPAATFNAQFNGTTLTLHNATSSPVQVSLYNLSGKRLMQAQVQSGSHSLEVGKFVPKGLYILKIKGPGQQKVMRVNVQ